MKYYGLDYWIYSNPGHYSDNNVKESVKREVKNQQVLEIYETGETKNFF